MTANTFPAHHIEAARHLLKAHCLVLGDPVGAVTEDILDLVCQRLTDLIGDFDQANALLDAAVALEEGK